MKSFLWTLLVIAVSASFIACEKSSEKFVNEVVDSSIKCETQEYDQATCDQLAIEFRARTRNFSDEEQELIQKQVRERFFVELQKLNGKDSEN